MSISPQIHDVSVSPSNSCNCCDNISCCVPFLGRKIKHIHSDIKVVRTADEALQKNSDSPKVSLPIIVQDAVGKSDLKRVATMEHLDLI
jgi:hypothetical protein